MCLTFVQSKNMILDCHAERSEASGIRMRFMPNCWCEILRCAQNDMLHIPFSKLYLHKRQPDCIYGRRLKMAERKSILTALTMVSFFITAADAANPAPQVIRLEIPAPDVEDSAGGIIAADVNNDNKPDYLVTVRGHLAVYDNSGEKLWLKKTDIVVGGQSESEGLPGHHGPGTAAADVDNDGEIEVPYLTKDSVLHIVDGATGTKKSVAKPPVPDGAAGWEMAMIADFR